MTLSNDAVRYDDTMKAGYVPEMAHSVAVPARAATYVATCHNPTVYNGGTVVALDLVRSLGLLTEAEIFPDWRQGIQDLRTIPPLPGPG